MFCVTYLDPSNWNSPRYHICKDTLDHPEGEAVLTFDTQAKAAAWIVKFGLDNIDYSVDCYHNLKETWS